MKIAFIYFLFLHLSIFAHIQTDDIINTLANAISTQKASVLLKHFTPTVELNIEDKKASYRSQQATLVLDNFFNTYPPKNFRYLHQGKVKKSGHRYCIGEYKTVDNNIFKVFILFVKKENGLKISRLDFELEH